MKKNVPFDPGEICLLSPQAEMSKASHVAHQFEKFAVRHVKHYIGTTGLMIDSDVYLIVGLLLFHLGAADAHLHIDRRISRGELLGCFMHASTELCDNQTRQPSTVHHFIARLVGRFYNQRPYEVWGHGQVLGHSAARSQL